MCKIDTFVKSAPQWTLAVNSWLGMLEHRLVGPTDFVLLKTGEELITGTLPVTITCDVVKQAKVHYNNLHALIGHTRDAMVGGINAHLSDNPSTEEITATMDTFKYMEPLLDELDGFLGEVMEVIRLHDDKSSCTK